MLIGASCKKDTLINNSLIKGKWMVTEAHRDGKKTKMMSGAYFYFDDKYQLKGICNQHYSGISCGGVIISPTE